MAVGTGVECVCVCVCVCVSERERGGIILFSFTNYTATCLPSRKLSKLDEPDIQDTAEDAGTIS